MTKRNKLTIRVPYGLSAHDDKEAKAVLKVINEHRTGMGAETKAFEKKIAVLFGKKYGVAVNSGSSANLLAFEIMDLPKGSEVITPILTFSTTLAPILQKGLKPVFVDIKPRTFLIDIEKIEKKIKKNTKALMIPSLLGNIPDLARLRKIANKHKLFLVEDSCDTLGGTLNNKPTGIYSDISTTSFYGSHVINAAGNGGMILVNRSDWYERLLVLRGWGRSSGLFAESEDIKKRFSVSLAGIPYDGKFFFTEIGYNFMPMEIGSAFGLVQLEKLASFAKKRRDNFAELSKFFERWNNFFELPRQTEKTETSWLAFPITLRKNTPFSRLDIVKFLEEQNIQTRPVFTGNVLHQPAFKHLAHKNFEKMYPETDRVMYRSFLIGCHQSLTLPQIKHLKNSFDYFLKKYQ